MNLEPGNNAEEENKQVYNLKTADHFVPFTKENTLEDEEGEIKQGDYFKSAK